MKIHLPCRLFRMLITCFVAICSTSSFSYSSELKQVGAYAEDLSNNVYYYSPKTYKERLNLKNNLNLTEYEGIIFDELSYSSYGGAICQHPIGTYSSASLSSSISYNRDVYFRQNSCSSYGGAIYSCADASSDYYSHSIFNICGNEEVAFISNSAKYGGAIYNAASTTIGSNEDVSAVFNLSGNNVVEFLDNQSSYCGSGIYNGVLGQFAMSGNLSVIFRNNASISDTQYSCHGAAISNDFHAEFSIINNGSIEFIDNHCNGVAGEGGAIYGDGKTFTIDGNESVSFKGNSATATKHTGEGGAIYIDSIFSINNNGAVSFSDNSVAGVRSYGGAIYCTGENFFMRDNESVTFSGNLAHSSRFSGGDTDSRGAALYSYTDIAISGNGSISFANNASISTEGMNTTKASGGAIYSHYGVCTISENRTVSFLNNSARAIDSYSNAYASGGAIFIGSYGAIVLSGNGEMSFCGNFVAATSDFGDFKALGGAIYNEGTFSINGSGDVLFEKNAENNNGAYRLRSIYSKSSSSSSAILNLSVSDGHNITFRDSVYADGIVNLNREGGGDIIFTAATTESDLRDVKNGINGTATEIRNSKTSEFDTNARLFGGRLSVEDGAILKGQGITMMNGDNATIRLNNGTLDESSYDIDVSSGSGLEFEGRNNLTASSVYLDDGAFLNFTLGAENTMLNWNANLSLDGSLTINLKNNGDVLRSEYALLSMNASNSLSGWNNDALNVNGTSAERLVWDNNTLYYRPLLLLDSGTMDAENDLVIDDGSMGIGGSNDVSINGNGHTLTVKNEVQLVQMTVKNGIVKLVGEHNGIDSLSLTGGGELALAQGAGVTMGGVISMEARDKEELIISGDITLDNKGMNGKAGAQATVSHADAKVLGDATISNVRVEDSVIDLAEGSKVSFDHVMLDANTRITDAPATALLHDVTAELVASVNVTQTGVDTLSAGMTLVENDNAAEMLTLTSDAQVAIIVASTFDSLILGGDSLVQVCSGYDAELFGPYEYIGLRYTSGSDYAIFDTGLSVVLTLDGEHYAKAYRLQDGDSTIVFFNSRDAGATPEPATTTLSLLALASLAARRKRK